MFSGEVLCRVAKKPQEMKHAIIAYPHSNNLGDCIQSLVIPMLFEGQFAEVDRESLHSYRGEHLHLVCNGWFMENPDHWPPSDDITPLFISFHINPQARKKLTNTRNIAYLKKYEPIGCRDLYTRKLLENHGVRCYFSGCLTLCYRREMFPELPDRRHGVLLVGALDRLKPALYPGTTLFARLVQLVKYPLRYLKYRAASRRLERKLGELGAPVRRISQIAGMTDVRNGDTRQLALELIRQIASAELVVTSRIHTALPATALQTPVLFLTDGLGHINHRSRIEGLDKYFPSCTTRDLDALDLTEIRPLEKHLELSGRLMVQLKKALDLRLRV